MLFHVYCMYILIIVIPLHHIYIPFISSLLYISPYFFGKKMFFFQNPPLFFTIYSSYSIIKHAYTYISSCFRVQKPQRWKVGHPVLDIPTALFPISEFVLDEKFHRNASKFAIFYINENPNLLFPFFLFCARYFIFFPNSRFPRSG